MSRCYSGKNKPLYYDERELNEQTWTDFCNVNSEKDVQPTRVEDSRPVPTKEPSHLQELRHPL